MKTPDSAQHAPPSPVATKLPGPSRASTVIGFRLEPELAEALAQQAKALGVSPHELARHYLVEAMGLAGELHSLVSGVTALHHQIQAFRHDLSLGVEALLASAGQVTEKDARAWVESSLNRQ